MKNYILSIIACLFVGILPANAQKRVYESYMLANTYQNLVYNDGQIHIVYVDDNVKLAGTVIVKNGSEVFFIGRGNSKGNTGTLTMSNAHAEVHRPVPMFSVDVGSRLEFNNYPYRALNLNMLPIIIDGGADFADMNTSSEVEVWQLTPRSNRTFATAVIESVGALELHNVTIRNVNIKEDNPTVNGVITLGDTSFGKSYGSGHKTSDSYPYYWVSINNCLVEKCKAKMGTFIYVGPCHFFDKTLNPNDASRFITIQNSTIRNNVTMSDASGWGGLIRCRGTSLYSMRLINSVFEKNFSCGDGGVLWWNASGHSNTKCTINGCTFRNNRAMRDAGALRLEASFELTGNKTLVTGNECLGKKRTRNGVNSEWSDSFEIDPSHPGRGGGIQIYGYAGTTYSVGGVFTYNLPSCLEVTNNYARSYGGGISFNLTEEANLNVGTTINAEFIGAVVKKNIAGSDGGGMYFSNTSKPEKNYIVNILFNGGDISENTSLNGGGLYVKNINIGSNANSTDIAISKNTASAGSGGGIYLTNGSVSLQSVNIENNLTYKDKANASAKYGGGGIYVNNGSFSMASGNISGNSSNMYGGGVFVQNEATGAVKQDISLTGGTIKKNIALYGGGIAACGALKLDINDIEIESNTAQNGGGLFVQGISSSVTIDLSYKKGIIRYNKANRSNNQTLTTAYGMDHKKLSGMGGGIYMDSYSTMSFPNPNHFGIYQNQADNGADDIFGSNTGVTITLPDINNLNLQGYSEAKIHKLFWGEDYITNDTNYGYGLKLKGDLWDSDRTNQRYRDVFERKVEGNYYVIDFGNRDYIQYTDKYLSLTVGWYVSSLKIYKEGMKAGENAIFKIYKVDGSSLTEYMTVVLTDADKVDDNVRLKQVVLKNDGTYRIVETGWSWAYDANVNSIQRTLNSSSKPEDYEFRFKNTEKNNSSRRDEDIKINKMKF